MMPLCRLAFALLLPMSFTAAGAQAQRPPSAARIVVGPNVLVSRDGDMAHVELIVAANPRDARNLLGGAITASRPNGGTATKTYASMDGGQSWINARFDEQMRYGGGDPQVLFTPQGTALFATLAMTPDENGRTRGGMHVYRSEDGGRTWGRPADLHWSWDHPQISVDRTAGRYAGRVYIGVLYGYPVYRVGIFRSEDDGRTFIGPVEAVNGAGKLGINVVNTMVLSDGMLVVPYIDFDFHPDRPAQDSSGLWLVTSVNGALTFTQPVHIAQRRVNRDIAVNTFPALAADSRSAKYRDQLYAVWPDISTGTPRIVFTRSTDRGRSWSAPHPIDAASPAAAWQFQPVIAVNDSGVVAVTWFDSRDTGDSRHYHEYFTASLDGGASWLPPVRVSTAPSDRYGAGNVRFTPSAFRSTPDSMRIAFLSPAARWGDGGDYMGLVADTRGVFHPFWADSRTGTFQIMTASVSVETSPAAAMPDVARRAPATITGAIDVIFNATRYNGDAKVASLPVRLRNTSDRVLYGPIQLVIRGFGSGQGSEQQDMAPAILNATNGKQGIGAIFDFTDALGTLRMLAPGAQTGPVEIRVRVKDPLNVPDLHIEVTGVSGGVSPSD